MRDSYIGFISKGYITKEQFFEFGLEETIYAPLEKAELAWQQLKSRINNNEEVFIRGFGRDSKGTVLYKELYQRMLGIGITKDPTNNSEPRKLIEKLTGYAKIKNKKYELIRNYQISHVFGRTKNIYAFTAPWNIVYMPKILDPLTGHEAKGDMVIEYTSRFQQQTYEKFSSLINDFNEIMNSDSFTDNLNNCFHSLESDGSFEKKDIERLKASVENEFKPIEV